MEGEKGEIGRNYFSTNRQIRSRDISTEPAHSQPTRLTRESFGHCLLTKAIFFVLNSRSDKNIVQHNLNLGEKENNKRPQPASVGSSTASNVQPPMMYSEQYQQWEAFH